MSFPSVYNPSVANLADQDNVSLCKILDAVSGTNLQWDSVELSNYSGSNPGTIVYKVGGRVVSTLTLTWSGSNLTSISRS